MIVVTNIAKHFGLVRALDDVSLSINEGEFFALLGPSGCGKTTLLRIMAGLETPTRGQLLIDGDDMSRVPPNKRPVNMVFQSYAVFPHMTVKENVAYGLRVTQTAPADIDTQVRDALSLVQLTGFEKRRPDQLSGGQRQRVALARALIKRPKVLLLDEPMSALDAKLRESMQIELVKLQQTLGITFVIVTHDQTEALSMADRIAVMDNGAIQQIADPKTLYDQPDNTFVADFIGKMNLFPGQIDSSDGVNMLVTLERMGTIELPGNRPCAPIHLAVRPEKIIVSTLDAPSNPVMTSFPAKLVNYVFQGSDTHLFLESSEGQVITVSLRNDQNLSISELQKGQSLRVSWRRDDALILDR